MFSQLNPNKLMAFQNKLKDAVKLSLAAGEDFSKMKLLTVTLASGDKFTGTVCEIGDDYFVLNGELPGGGKPQYNVRFDQVAEFHKANHWKC